MSTSANGQDVRFKHLTIEEGLSQNAILSVAKDYRGFMWFGTRDGLNRYDGYNFRIYRHDPTDSMSLINNEVTVLYEDKAQNLWIGAGGLHRYDRSTDRVERIVAVEDISSAPRIFISDIEADHRGDIWFSVTDIGIYRISPEVDGNGGKDYRLQGPYLLSGRDNNPAFKMADLHSADQEMWMSYQGGLFRLRSDKNGDFPQPAHKKFDKISLPLLEKKLRFSSLFQDQQNTLWATTDEGLLRIDNHNNPESATLFDYPDNYYRIDCIHCGKEIAIDKQGQFWMTTFEGLIRYKPEDNTYQLYKNNPDDPASLSLDNTTDLLIDGSVLWVGTMGMGIDIYDASQINFQHYLDRKKSGRLYSLYNLLVDEQQKVWFIDSYKNLSYLDTKNNMVDIIKPDPQSNWALADMKKDSAGKFWLVSKDALIFFDPLNQQYKTYRIPETEHPFTWSYEYKLFIESDQKIWLCNSQHFILFDKQTEQFKFFDMPQIEIEHINYIYQDVNSKLWIGTIQSLLHYDPTTGKYRTFGKFAPQKDSLNFPLVKHIMPDPKEPGKVLWLSTGGGGIYRFDMSSLVFKAYTSEDGLPNDFVYGMLTDDFGKFWISTNKGISRFDPDRGTFFNFTTKDGLQSDEFNSDAFYKSEEGKLYFGGINGLTVLMPESGSFKLGAPPVVITEMQLMYEQVSPFDPGSPLKQAITETKELSLNHDQNNLAFAYAALEYSYPEKIKYRYKLEGFDREWVFAGDERLASYTNLSPGEYTFRVGVSNDGKNWSQREASLGIAVLPPFWKTWWAYSFYFISFTVVVFLVYRFQMERVRMNEQIKRNAFESERQAELEQFKSDFFANVSHELRTPLTIVVSKLDEGMAEGKENRKLLQTLETAKDNTRKVSELIDQLLDISRLENGKIEIKLIEEDLAHLINLICVSLQPIADKKSITIVFSSPVESKYVYLAPDIIQKIFQNLIVNALKYTSPHGKIMVSIKPEQPANNAVTDLQWITMTVSDNGVGISEEEQAHVFDRFYQGHHNTKGEKEGFGLGLSLVSELVKLLEGRIQVDSMPGKGTVFTLHLPFQSARPTPSLTEQNMPVRPGVDTYANQELPRTIEEDLKNKDESPSLLVVEDHEELRKLLYQQLSKDFKVQLAANGSEGLTMAKKIIPDLIIADLMMPEKDGYAMSLELKSDETTSHIPIIMLTAQGDQAIKLKSLKAGIDNYLTKPFDQTELKISITNLIKSRNQLRSRYMRIFSGQLKETKELTLEETFLIRLTGLVRQNITDEHFGVDALASGVSMSTSQLYRKVKALTGLSTLQFMQQYRLQEAKKLLEKGYNVSETTFMVGFTNPPYFSQLFKKHTSCTPLEYARKFRRDNESANS